MKTTRHGVFETNSSSTHTVSIIPKDVQKKLKEDEGLWFHEKHGLKSLDEAIKFLPKHEQENLAEYEDAYERRCEARYYLHCEGWFSYGGLNEDLEYDEKDYTSKSGDQIVVVCQYGYDG